MQCLAEAFDATFRFAKTSLGLTWIAPKRKANIEAQDPKASVATLANFECVEEGSTTAATDAGSTPSTQPPSPTNSRMSLLSCPFQDLAYYLPSNDLGRLSGSSKALRSELTVEPFDGKEGRRLLVPVVELRVENAEDELKRVSLPHIRIMRIWKRLPFVAVAAEAARKGPNALRCLEKFVCKGCPMDAHDVNNGLVKILIATQGIKLLNLEHNRITDPTIEALCDSGALSYVETLNLRFNEIGDRGAIALANNKHATQLKWINLKMNRLGDEGALALASMISKSSSMTLLNLRRQIPGLTDRAALGFASMLQQNSSLEQLRFRRNRITDKGAAALASASAERLHRLCAEAPPGHDVHFELDLEQNRVKENGGLALAQAADAIPKRARVQFLLFGNPVTRDSLCQTVKDAELSLDACSSRLWFDSKPEFEL